MDGELIDLRKVTVWVLGVNPLNGKNAGGGGGRAEGG